jgi:hypothetical protein
MFQAPDSPVTSMDRKHFILNQWSVSYEGDPDYSAPEAMRICLRGRTDDGREVRTSYIVTVEGRRITTRSGSVYTLGIVDPDYLKWLKTNGISYNERQPITIHKKAVIA